MDQLELRLDHADSSRSDLARSLTLNAFDLHELIFNFDQLESIKVNDQSSQTR